MSRFLPLCFPAVVALTPCLALPAFASPWTVLASSGVQAVSTGAGVSGDLGLTWPWSRHWGLALSGRMGGVMPGETADPSHHGHLLLGLLIGPSFSTAWGDRTTHVALQFQHIHHTTAQEWLGHPLANLAGDSSGSVLHHTGLEVSSGVTWPTGVRMGGWGLVLDTSVAASVLPGSDQMAWTVGAHLGIGLASRD
jgi:hypothetical protein